MSLVKLFRFIENWSAVSEFIWYRSKHLTGKKFSDQKGLNVFLVILIKATKPHAILIWFVVTKTSFTIQVCGVGLNRQTILRFSCPVFCVEDNIQYRDSFHFSFASHRWWLMDWANVKYLFWAQKLRAISNRGI